jgi:hypothetical protein
MTFQGDDRGVTVQIGAVLLFGTLIIALSVYQATAVPAENKQVEYRHSQQVQGQLQDVRNALVRSAATETTQPTSVSLGTQYPERVLFVNPPPLSGTLRTVGTANADVNVTIENASSPTAEVSDYWNGSDRTFETGALAYAPDYSVYDEAPTTVVENTVVYNAFESGRELRVSEQTMVDGRRINLVLVNGSLSRSGSGTVDVAPRPLSTSTERVTLRNETSNMTLQLSTRLPESKWRSMLADEPYVSVGDYRSPTSAEFSRVELQLSSGETYRLNIARIGVGSVSDPTSEAAYVAPNFESPPTLVEDTTATFSYVVSDEYGNPVSNETVWFEVRNSGGTTLVANRTATDAEGLATFDYTPRDSSVNATIDVRITQTNPAAAERVTHSDRPVFGPGGVADGGSSDINPAEHGDVQLVDENLNGADTIDLVLNNTGDTDLDITKARLNFYLTDSRHEYDSATLLGATSPDSPMDIGGTFVAYPDGSRVTLAGNGTETSVSVQFSPTGGGQPKLDGSDFFVITIIYTNGETDTYFVSPPT